MSSTGVPLLTLPREKHAGRLVAVALGGSGHIAFSHFRRHSASMLSALQGAASSTIARNMEDYRDIAVKLLKRPHALLRVQESLKKNWESSPLFDVGRWVGDVEVRDA